MPRIMFQEVVCPSADANRKWYTLPLSFLVHTLALAILIAVPLLATDVLPTPRTLLNYWTAEAPPMPVAVVPPAPRRIQQTDLTRANFDAAPVDAPPVIGRETGLEVIAKPMARGADGLVEGLGAHQAIIDAPPVVREPVMQPVRISSGIKPPVRIKDVSPVYPEIARNARVQGIVILEAIIGVDGRVQRARVLRSVPLLDQAAVNAVQSWEYTPTLLDGRPVPIIMTVTVNFRLE
jgi:periplasmic protein TonB